MKPKTPTICLHCRRSFTTDHRNRGRQQYCTQPGCPKGSKAASHRKWLNKPENQDYFRGLENTRRVQQWRLENPGYGARGRGRKKVALQDSLERAETIDHQPGKETATGDALQETYFSQHSVIVGFISVLTGQTLQDDIAKTTKALAERGMDILKQSKNSIQS